MARRSDSLRSDTRSDSLRSDPLYKYNIKWRHPYPRTRCITIQTTNNPNISSQTTARRCELFSFSQKQMQTVFAETKLHLILFICYFSCASIWTSGICGFRLPTKYENEACKRSECSVSKIKSSGKSFYYLICYFMIMLLLAVYV